MATTERNNLLCAICADGVDLFVFLMAGLLVGLFLVHICIMVRIKNQITTIRKA